LPSDHETGAVSASSEHQYEPIFRLIKRNTFSILPDSRPGLQAAMHKARAIRPAPAAECRYPSKNSRLNPELRAQPVRESYWITGADQ
jgi:hypothetical protein